MALFWHMLQVQSQRVAGLFPVVSDSHRLTYWPATSLQVTECERSMHLIAKSRSGGWYPFFVFVRSRVHIGCGRDTCYSRTQVRPTRATSAWAAAAANLGVIFSILKMDAIYSSEMSVDTQRTTRRYIPEDGTLHNHRCENLKSYQCNPVLLIINSSPYRTVVLSFHLRSDLETWGFPRSCCTELVRKSCSPIRDICLAQEGTFLNRNEN
jgi:hypothetical protein